MAAPAERAAAGQGGWSVGVLKAGTTSLLTLLDSPAVTAGCPGAAGTSTGLCRSWWDRRRRLSVGGMGAAGFEPATSRV